MKKFLFCFLILFAIASHHASAQSQLPYCNDSSSGEAGAPACRPLPPEQPDCGEGMPCPVPLPTCAPTPAFVPDPGCGEAGGPPCYDWRPAQTGCTQPVPQPSPYQY